MASSLPDRMPDDLPSQQPTHNAVAGPSTSRFAPTYHLPKTAFNSIEYPGPIRPSPASLKKALATLGGSRVSPRPSNETTTDSLTNGTNEPSPDIDAVFNHATKVLELRLRPEDPWAHPIIGEAAASQKLVVKIVKRGRKRKGEAGRHIDPGLVASQPEGDAEGVQSGQHSTKKDGDAGGVFTAKIVGVSKQTVRFRGIADYQYMVNPEHRMVQLSSHLAAADPAAILNFAWAPLDEKYFESIDDDSSMAVGTNAQTEESKRRFSDADIHHRSRIGMLPPPLFSRQVVPHIFDYAHNPTSKVTEYEDPVTGQARQRLYNTGRAKTFGTLPAKFDDVQVPVEPVPLVQQAEKSLEKELMAKLRALFTSRKAWSRAALLNQFPSNERKILDSKRAHIPAVCYTWQDGPFRDTLFPFGYDARKDCGSYIYQKVYFRNMREDTGIRPTTRRKLDSEYEGAARGSRAAERLNLERLQQARQQQEQSQEDAPADETLGHVFDGKILHRDVGNYQLIDIHDPLLASMIHDERAKQDKCDFVSGWLKPKQFEAIKKVLRRKWLALAEGGLCTDADCADLMEEFWDFDNTRQTQTQRDAEADEIDEGQEDDEVAAQEDDAEVAADDVAAPAQPEKSKRGGRPKGGGGYAAGKVPTGTSVLGAQNRRDRWKRRGVARLPMREEEQTALRLREALQRQEDTIRRGQRFREQDKEEDQHKLGGPLEGGDADHDDDV